MGKQKNKNNSQLDTIMDDIIEEMQDSNDTYKEQDFDLQDIYSDLDSQIPSKPKFEVKSEKSSKNKIDDYNNDIITIYLKGEQAHLNGQKPVSIIIAISVGLQLVAFNVLIYIVSLGVFYNTKLELLLDFMKYYTGAVIVEMLGMCLIIIKGVFSMRLGKMVEHILNKKKDI